MKILKYLVYALVVLLVFGYGFLFWQVNQDIINDTINVDFVGFALSGPIAYFLLGALVLGVALASLAGIGVMLSLKARQIQSARKVKKIDKEMSKMRQSAPVA